MIQWNGNHGKCFNNGKFVGNVYFNESSKLVEIVRDHKTKMTENDIENIEKTYRLR